MGGLETNTMRTNVAFSAQTSGSFLVNANEPPLLPPKMPPHQIIIMQLAQHTTALFAISAMEFSKQSIYWTRVNVQ